MFYADLHIHSKYSRATSKDCDLENLALWGAKKGLSIISTGDFTHPVWFFEIQNKLVYSGNGVFKLKDEIAKKVFKDYPDLIPPKFILSVEISTIYKKKDKTRKVHHVIFMPDIESASKFREKLSLIGNIKSDGRPILGFNSRNLLEIVLETNKDGFIIPAHIWTPWFSVLGSKSGFDSIEECYEDLSEYIFALETGLSSDPYMNWRVSKLDKYTLVSNSDAHSPSKLAREANIFNCDKNYFAIKNALITLDGYVGTIEFFPEEGKYHADGHRKCGICLNSVETKKLKGICPVCKKPLTIGVSYRVEELADRKYGEIIPKKAGKVYSLIPLVEIIAEIYGVSATSKKVSFEYEKLIQSLGSELDILQNIELLKIEKKSPLLAEAISRLREEKVIKKSGYDGEYGVIKLFCKGEIDSFYNLKLNLDIKKGEKKNSIKYEPFDNKKEPEKEREIKVYEPDKYQLEAINSNKTKLLIQALPGSGKTSVLVKRIEYLIINKNIIPKNILAITFTKKAAGELKDRLEKLINKKAIFNIHTFHSLCYKILKEKGEFINIKPDFRIISDNEKDFYREDEIPENSLTFDDLITKTLELLNNPDIKNHYQEKFKYIFIDEYQDIDEKQYNLIKILTSNNTNLFAIGDINQAIYGFRGGSAKFFKNFSMDFLETKTINLINNYRSSKNIVEVSNQLINSSKSVSKRDIEKEKITIYKAPTPKAEAEFIVSKIENIIDGRSFFSFDSNRVSGWGNEKNYAFSDFAILYRTKSQLDSIKEALDRIAMPYASYSEETLSDNKNIKKLLSNLNENSSLYHQLFQLKNDYKNLIEENIYALLIEMSKKYPKKEDFYHEVAFLKEYDSYDKKADRISLMTLHASKGLEFSCVFIAGAEDGLLPLYLAKEKEEIDEEKRLLYVGLTRAKDLLYLSFCAKRNIRGIFEKRNISPFLSNIDEKYINYLEFDKYKKKNLVKQLKLFNL